MEMGDNEVDLTTPSNDSNDPMNTLEKRVPECDDKLKPTVAKVFDTLEEGGNFYKSYAHAASFSICNSFETKDKSGVRWKYFVWLKEGFKAEKKIVQLET